ncbi:MAG: ugpQ 4, partial [Phycisphaerales bacterium]|nr:ugpQ 4 [Phycisphaerales bacterium]
LRKTNFADVTQLQVHVRLKPDIDPKKPAEWFTPSDAFLRAAGQELRAHKITYQSLPWYSNHAQVYWRLMDLGVMSFATDHPDVTLDAVKRYYAGESNDTSPAAGPIVPTNASEGKAK